MASRATSELQTFLFKTNRSGRAPFAGTLFAKKKLSKLFLFFNKKKFLEVRPLKRSEKKNLIMWELRDTEMKGQVTFNQPRVVSRGREEKICLRRTAM